MTKNPSPFIDSLLKVFLRLAHKEGFGSEVQKLTPSDKILLKVVLKTNYLSRPNESMHGTKKAADFLSSLGELKKVTADLEQFDLLCTKTLLLYRKHEDDIRHFDFINKESQNTLEDPKADGRSAQPQIEVESLGDILERIEQQIADGSYAANAYDLINPELDFDTVKQRVRKLYKQIDIVTNFYEAYYNSLHNATDVMYETKMELMRLSNVIAGAVETNIKNHDDLDVFFFIIHEQLHINSATTQQVNDRLRTINSLLNLNKNLSDESIRTIIQKARKIINNNPQLKSFCSKLVDLSRFSPA